MVAMKEWVNEESKTTSYFASDHLSSTSLVMDSSGNLLSENRYMPFGETRTISGTTSITETDFGYTGQRDYSGDFGLMDYRARFYSPALGRFTQPDTIVPDPGSSQAWNRYAYVENNPITAIDLSGHFAVKISGDLEDAGYSEQDGIELVNAYLDELSNTETGKILADEFRAIDAEEGININFGSFVSDELNTNAAIGTTMYLKSSFLTDGKDFSDYKAIDNMLMFAHESVHLIQNAELDNERFFTMMAENEAYLVQGMIYEEYSEYNSENMPKNRVGAEYMYNQVITQGRCWYDPNVLIGLKEKYRNEGNWIESLYDYYPPYPANVDGDNDLVLDLDLSEQ